MGATQVPGLLEIRVHGVSGTPPQDMLGVPADEVGQVAGDQLTGLYRCRPPSTPQGLTVPPYVAVEAYSWGALTSGAAGVLGWVRRAAWLTLLPFSLANLAYWARPELAADTRVRRVSAVVMRLACLWLTLLFVAGVCLIGIDLVAWQCVRGGSRVCPSLPAVLHFMEHPPWDSASRRVLIGSLLPLLALAGVWFLSRQSLARYEACVPANPPRGRGVNVLRRERMWNGTDRTRRLSRLHVSGGICVVVGYGSVALGTLRGSAAQLWLAGLGLAAVLALIAVNVAVALGYEDGIEFPGTLSGESGRGRRLALIVRILVWAMLVLHGLLLYRASGLDPGVLSGELRGHNLVVGMLLLLLVAAVGWLIFAMDHPLWSLLVPAGLIAAAVAAFASWWPLTGLLLGLVLLFGWLLKRRAGRVERRSSAWGGSGAAVLLGAAVWVAAIFTTSTVVLTADWLNGGEQSVADLQTGFEPGQSPGARAAMLEARSPALYATGAVVVRDAAVSVDQGVVTIHSGTVAVDSLRSARAVEPVRHLVPGLDLDSGRMVVADPPITLVDSCVGTTGVPICADPADAASPGEFVASATIEPSAALRLQAIDHDRPVHVQTAAIAQEPLIVPQVLVWVASSVPVWLIAIIGIVAVCLALFRWSATHEIRMQVRGDGVAETRIAGSLRVRVAAAFAHRAERLLGLFALVTSITALVVLAGAAGGAPPWHYAHRLRVLADAGLWVTLGVAAGLLAVGARMRTSASARRVAGVLWDLSTFWPRVAHPLGPPCYAERVVPEVVARVGWAAGLGAGTILSGHSQGSLIVVAVACQLPAGQIRDLRMITYGSQLRTLYGRLFPGVLGPQIIGYTPMTKAPGLCSAVPDAPDRGSAGTAFGGAPPGPVTSLGELLAVSARAPHWVNLFRRTDPIGFRVFDDQQSLVDRYVSEYSPGGIGDPNPSCQTHSRYQFSDQYREVVQDWYAQPGYPATAVGAVCQAEFQGPG